MATPPLDDVAICNLALDHLKQAPIVDIEEPSTQVEELMARQYPQARRATLRMHPWNFAAKRVELTPSPDDVPVIGFSRAYRKPLDFIRLISRIDSDGRRMDSDYDFEGDFIYMDADEDETIYIRYVRDIEDVGKMDPLFINLLAVNLAIAVASKFSGSENRATMLMKMQEKMLQEARTIDGQERPPRLISKSNFLAARRGLRVRTDQRYINFE